ncbi:hypothetical protein ADL35_01265 [Streptomyces sp. NRRL WC-3753]|nr:hypothetical protein ADL35_01265 [Streptomyces sp. NRRL WC-3753]
MAVEQPLHGVGGGTARGGRGRRLPHVSGLPTGATPLAAAVFTTTGLTTTALTKAACTNAGFTNAGFTRAVHTPRTVPLLVPATGAIVTAVGGARPADAIRVIRVPSVLRVQPVLRVLPVLRRTHALSPLVHLGAEGEGGRTGVTGRGGRVRSVAPVGEAGP